jgi:hypothetical protein
MGSSRFLAASGAAMLFIVSVGCGNDENKGLSSSDAGRSVSSSGSEARVASGQASPADQGATEFAWVRPDDVAAVMINLRRITTSPLVAEPLKDESIAEAVKKLGISPSDVERITVLIGVEKNQEGQSEPATVIVTRFAHQVNPEDVLNKFQAATRGGDPIHQVMVGGKTCFDLGAAKDAPLAYVPNKNTIILSTKEHMGKIVSAEQPSGPLLARLRKVDADNDVIITLALDAYPGLEKTLQEFKSVSGPQAAPYLSAAATVRGGTATLNLTAPSLLRMALETKDPAAAENLEELLQRSLRMAGGIIAVAKQSIPKETKASLDPLLKLADELVAGAKTAKSGSQVTAEIKRPEVLDTGAVSIVGALRQSILDARDDARGAQQMNRIRQVALAMVSYVDAKGAFPPSVLEKDGKPLLSWRVAVLPYLGEAALYGRFHLEEPWDSPHNLEIAKKMPAVFESPDNPGDGKTQIMLLTGKDAVFDGGKQIRPQQILDGMSRTLLCVEAGADKAVPWTKPEDLPFGLEKPLQALGQVSPKGFIAAFCDGSVHRLKVDNPTLKALVTPAGGEIIDPSKVNGGR